MNNESTLFNDIPPVKGIRPSNGVYCSQGSVVFIFDAGGYFIKIDRFFPSSKTCSSCGWIKQDLTLSIREWTCESCGEVHDRDVNAAKNILNEGLKIISAGTVDYTGGDLNQTSFEKHRSMKPEAQPIAFGVGG